MSGEIKRSGETEYRTPLLTRGFPSLAAFRLFEAIPFSPARRLISGQRQRQRSVVSGQWSVFSGIAFGGIGDDAAVGGLKPPTSSTPAEMLGPGTPPIHLFYLCSRRRS